MLAIKKLYRNFNIEFVNHRIYDMIYIFININKTIPYRVSQKKVPVFLNFFPKTLRHEMEI